VARRCRWWRERGACGVAQAKTARGTNCVMDYLQRFFWIPWLACRRLAGYRRGEETTQALGLRRAGWLSAASARAPLRRSAVPAPGQSDWRPDFRPLVPVPASLADVLSVRQNPIPGDTSRPNATAISFLAYCLVIDKRSHYMSVGAAAATGFWHEVGALSRWRPGRRPWAAFCAGRMQGAGSGTAGQLGHDVAGETHLVCRDRLWFG
jgi:hypothetical protein